MFGTEESMRDRPLMAVVEGDGLSLADLERGFLEEVLELAERWASRLPASSRFYGTVVLWQGLARRGLGPRERVTLQARPGGR